jgi:hypothetical protein
VLKKIVVLWNVEGDSHGAGVDADVLSAARQRLWGPFLIGSAYNE